MRMDRGVTRPRAGNGRFCKIRAVKLGELTLSQSGVLQLRLSANRNAWRTAADGQLMWRPQP